MNPITPLMTDLYELTMAAGYFDRKIDAPATFCLYTRSQPQRAFFVAAGLETVLDALSQWRFDRSDLTYLRHTGLFKSDFLAWLADLRFTGEVRALAEGTVFFADEPILEITAPIIQAQLLETYLINTVALASLIATKAARCMFAAEGRSLIDFALRRTQGFDAGLAVARSTYLAGFSATSNVLAGKLYGIPVAGTMAHSFVMAFEREIDAFRAYAQLFPDRTVFLIDTYDTLEGARLATQVAQEMANQGHLLTAVRLDSGDRVALSRQVRRILDQAGCQQVKILASGGYDEFKIAEALKHQAPIDGFGVGTRVGVSADAPYLDMVYKLVHFDGRDVRKLSPGKQTLAGSKQLFRTYDKERLIASDIIGHAQETFPGTEALLQTVMQAGQRLSPANDLTELRERCRLNLLGLPTHYKQLRSSERFPIRISERLTRLQPHP